MNAPRTIDHGGAAFPDEIQDGMTLRDYFAAQAIPALVDYFSTPDSGEGRCSFNSDAVAKRAYAIADAMIARRQEQP